MNYRLIVVILALLVLMSANGKTTFAYEDHDSQGEQQMMSLSPEMDPEKDFIAERFNLTAYQALAEGDPSLCGDNQRCMEEATMIQAWFCAADICNATNRTKNPLDCFGDSFAGDLNMLAASLCALIKSSNSETRKEFLSRLSDARLTEDIIVEVGAYLMALNGSEEACMNYIKDYKGPYGPNWTYRWYKFLAACRILSGTRGHEGFERDFLNWYYDDYCPLITDGELRKACDAAGGVLPFSDEW